MIPRPRLKGEHASQPTAALTGLGAVVARTPIGLLTSAGVGLAKVYGTIKHIDGETRTTVRIMLCPLRPTKKRSKRSSMARRKRWRYR